MEKNQFTELLSKFIPQGRWPKFFAICFIAFSAILAIFTFTSCGSLKLHRDTEIKQTIDYNRSERVYRNGVFEVAENSSTSKTVYFNPSN